MKQCVNSSVGNQHNQLERNLHWEFFRPHAELPIVLIPILMTVFHLQNFTESQ